MCVCILYTPRLVVVHHSLQATAPESVAQTPGRLIENAWAACLSGLDTIPHSMHKQTKQRWTKCSASLKPVMKIRHAARSSVVLARTQATCTRPRKLHESCVFPLSHEAMGGVMVSFAVRACRWSWRESSSFFDTCLPSQYMAPSHFPEAAFAAALLAEAMDTLWCLPSVGLALRPHLFRQAPQCALLLAVLAGSASCN